MTSENNLRDRIEEELAGLRPPPRAGIPGEALAHGRRIRRRQRVLGTAGTVVALVGVTAGTVALVGGFASGGTDSTVSPGGLAPVAQHPPAAVAPTTTLQVPIAPASSSSQPSGPADPTSSGPKTKIGTIPAAWQPPAPAGGHLTHPAATDGQSVAALLLDDLGLIASGSGSGFSGGSLPGTNANTTLTWTTQHGSIRMSASVSDDGADGKTPQSKCSPAYEVDYCAAGTLTDGSVVMVEHSTGEPASGPPTHDNSITISRPDHTAVTVVEWSNGPLTDDQLYKIVSDPRWGLKMDGAFVAHADQSVPPFSG